MKRITPQAQSDQGGSGIGIVALVAVLGVAAFYQLSQNQVQKQKHDVSVASIASKETKAKLELAKLREQRRRDNITVFEKTQAEIDEEKEIAER